MDNLFPYNIMEWQILKRKVGSLSHYGCGHQTVLSAEVDYSREDHAGAKI